MNRARHQKPAHHFKRVWIWLLGFPHSDMSEVTQFCRGQSVFRTISPITHPINKDSCPPSCSYPTGFPRSGAGGRRGGRTIPRRPRAGRGGCRCTGWPPPGSRPEITTEPTLTKMAAIVIRSLSLETASLPRTSGTADWSRLNSSSLAKRLYFFTILCPRKRT